MGSEFLQNCLPSKRRFGFPSSLRFALLPHCEDLGQPFTHPGLAVLFAALRAAGARLPQPALEMTLGLPCPWEQVFHPAKAQPLKLCSGGTSAGLTASCRGCPSCVSIYSNRPASCFPLSSCYQKKITISPSCPEGSNAEILLKDQELAAPEIKGNIKVKCLMKDSPGLVLSVWK